MERFRSAQCHNTISLLCLRAFNFAAIRIRIETEGGDNSRMLSHADRTLHIHPHWPRCPILGSSLLIRHSTARSTLLSHYRVCCRDRRNSATACSVGRVWWTFYWHWWSRRMSITRWECCLCVCPFVYVLPSMTLFVLLSMISCILPDWCICISLSLSDSSPSCCLICFFYRFFLLFCFSPCIVPVAPSHPSLYSTFYNFLSIPNHFTLTVSPCRRRLLGLTSSCKCTACKIPSFHWIWSILQ